MASKKRKPRGPRAVIEIIGKNRFVRAHPKSWRLMERYEKLGVRQQIEFLVLLSFSAGAGGKALRTMRWKAREYKGVFSTMLEVGDLLRRRRNPGKPKLRDIVRRLYIKDGLSDGQIAKNQEVLNARNGERWSRGGVEQMRRRWKISR